MLNLLLFLFFIACISITGAWVAEHPGQVVVRWFDYRIDTSLAFLLLAAFLLAIIFAYGLALVRAIINAPRRLKEHRDLKHYQRAISEVTYSVASLASGDLRNAEAHTRKAERLLGATPLTLLLSAQISRSRGDDQKTRILLEKMLEHEETEYMAARSLSDSASKQQHFPKALAMAERAHAINPKDASGIAAILSLHIRLGQWQEALQTLNKAGRKANIGSADYARYKGLILLKHGSVQLEEGHHDLGLRTTMAALKTLKYYPPAVIAVARAYEAREQNMKAIKTILIAWKFSPHPELADLFRRLSADQPPAKQIKLGRALVARAPHSTEGYLSLAQTAISQREWGVARQAMREAIDIRETAQACRLMADIEQGESGDYDAAGHWLARSANALPDATWNCRACGHIPQHWDVHCPSCGAFDTLIFKFNG